jgi:hypothetical protein
MTAMRAGDRIRVRSVGDDGLPMVRYGFVGSLTGPSGPVVVMLDGELGGDVLPLDEVELVTVENVELHLHGDDLLSDPDLRRGLVGMWRAEADLAGIAVDTVTCMGDGMADTCDSFALAELMTGGDQFVVRVLRDPATPGQICVRADRPMRWHF